MYLPGSHALVASVSANSVMGSPSETIAEIRDTVLPNFGIFVTFAILGVVVTLVIKGLLSS